MMLATSPLMKRTGARGLVTLLALLAAVFCLASFVPAADADPGCQGHQLCAQSGPSVPMAVVVEDMPRWEGTKESTTWLPAQPVLLAASQLRATPSAPRAPPQPLA